MVNFGTVAEQLVYEIADPTHYVLPEVICDFSKVTLSEVAADQVRVIGAKGQAPTSKYKVCSTYVDDFRLNTTFFVAGLESEKKARAIVDAIEKKTKTYVIDPYFHQGMV